MEEPKKKKLGIDYWIPAILLFLMVIVVMIQVCTRMAGCPITWGEEIARWILIWIIFSGLSYAFKDGGLISVDFFIKKLNPNVQKKIHYFDMATTIVYFCILFVSAGSYFKLLSEKEQVFPVTKAPATLTVAAMLAGCVLAVVFAVKQFKTIKRTDYGKKESE